MKGFDPDALFAQARKMKDQMAEVEKDLAERMVEGKAGDGLVTVVCSGSLEVQAIRLKPAAVDPDDLELLEDLLLVAVKSALEKATALRDGEMSKVTGGMNLPGM